MPTITNTYNALDTKTFAILVIEDNLGDYALVEALLLEQIKAPVITHTTSFTEAKLCISAQIYPFDVILLDLSLPDNTGEPLIREIIALCPSSPVIVLTGYTDFNFGVRSLSFGASDYLLKDDLTATTLYKSIVYSAERKKTMTELEESEKRYGEVFDFSPLPMWVVNLETLAFMDVNQATVRHFGYSREELLTMNLRDIRPEDDIPDLEKIFKESKQYPDQITRRQTIHRRKNGDLREVEIQFAQFQYKGMLSNVVIATDVTERLNYIKAIEEQNEKLREISWIQSHVVRAPLSRIMGLVSLITQSLTTDNDREEMLHYLSQSANELDLVIKDITQKSNITETGAGCNSAIPFKYAPAQ